MNSTAKSFALPNGMTLMEYLKTEEVKERIRKAREEYQQKHARNTR